MGSERNRSMTPLVRSSARPDAVPSPAEQANWASRPGISQLT